MAYLTLNQLEVIQVDFTSYCNSMCASCSRNIDGVSVNSNMPLSHMSFDIWKKIFTPKITKGVVEIIFNGSYGDPIFNPNLIPALEYILSITDTPPVITIHTNGGLGTPKLFKNIAKTLKKFPVPSHITFSIDGLEDTNHLYRRGVVWNNIMKNAQAFIDEGGLARWRMLVFKHNSHQLKDCEQLAYKMGFKKFDINGGYPSTSIQAVENNAIENFAANKKESARLIEYETAYLDNLNRINSLKGQYGDLDTAFAACPIQCKWQKKRKIQVSHVGEIFPCCYFLNDRYPKNSNNEYAKDIENMLKFDTPGWNNVNNYDIEHILENDFFKKYLTDSWNSDNKYKICARNCGQ
jgi:MoaA/NifB/PqqE/SkfB family radical SAM enzyme